MKHEKDSKDLKRLIEAFKSAEKKVGVELQKSKTSAQLKINVDKQNKTNEFKLLQEVKRWAEKELPEAFQQGYESARRDDDVKGLVPQTTFYDFTQSVLPYIEIGSKVHESVAEYSASINKKIEELERTEYVTIEKVKNTIIEEVGDMPFIRYENGARMPLSKYAEMLARTSRIETANGGIVARCKDIKRDLVRYLALDSCCPHCKKFSGKVFSISGKDKRFPYLYGDKGPFREGYNITHPNCRCEIMPFIDELYSDEMDEIIKSSNRLTEFDKNDKMFDSYNKAQAHNRQANAELVEYTRLKQTLGKQFPYKTLGSFRRAKRQDSNTYERLKAQARTKTYKVEAKERKLEDFKSLKKVFESPDFEKKIIFSRPSKFGGTGQQDEILKPLLKEIGFDKKPQKVSSKEFEELSEKSTILYRGFTEEQHAKEFVEGEYFVGLGVNGSGTYTTTNESRAKSYAKENGVVVKMLLNADAKVVKMDDLIREANLVRENLRLNNTAYEDIEKMNTIANERDKKLEILLAITHGYDAVDYIQDTIILNRSVVIVEDSDER